MTIYELLALIGVGVGIVISIISAIASCKSAGASKNSSKIANDALGFAKEKAEKERIHKEVDRIIEVGKDYSKGIRDLMDACPDLVTRTDFPEICKPIVQARRCSVKNMRGIFEDLKKLGRISEIQGHWEF